MVQDKWLTIDELPVYQIMGRTKLYRMTYDGEIPASRVACIGGHWFDVRGEDMKKMILATRGKVFTAKTLNLIVECTRLKEFSSARHLP